MASQVNLDYQTIWTPRRIGSQQSSHASKSQRQPTAPSHEVARLSVVDDVPPEEAPSPSPARMSGNDDLIYISDVAVSDINEASCGELVDEKLLSVKDNVQSMVEETGIINCTVNDREQASKCEHEREATNRSASSTLPEYKQVNYSSRLSPCEPATNRLAGNWSLTARTRASTTSTPVTSRTDSPSPQSYSWGAVSTQTSCTSVSAANEGPSNADIGTLIQTHLADESDCDSSAAKSTRDKNTPNKPLMRHTRRRQQSKRIREASPDHFTELLSAEDLSRASGDAEYCPPTDHESEGDSDGQLSDVGRSSRKRRKFRTIPRSTRSPSEENHRCDSADFDQEVDLPSPAESKRAACATEFTDAAFDEWILQDVVLKRTIMSGKATFQVQFEWDLCMKHGVETGTGRKPAIRQNLAAVAKGCARRIFTREEDECLVDLKERQGLPWAEIHRRFCKRFTERSKQSLQVRYCTKLKHRDLY